MSLGRGITGFHRYTLLRLDRYKFDIMAATKERPSDMKQRTLIRLLIVLFAILATVPATAQVYKWVDERGVTNYSNQPPADPKAVKKLGVVEDKISVYTPDPALMQAIAAFQQQRINRALAEAIGSLELEAERRAGQYGAGAPACYDPCLDGGGINCSGVYGGYYPYVPAVAVIPFRHRAQSFAQTRWVPGKTVRTSFPSRPFHSATISRGHPTR